MMPVSTSTLSLWIILSAICTASSGFMRVVLDDDLDVLVAGLLDRQHEAVAHIDAKAGAAARQRRDHADLDGLGEGGARGAQRQGDQRLLRTWSSLRSPCDFEQGIKVPENTCG